jgi:uncharacterized membrane protein YbhN (UPF0104 family)
MKRLVLKFRAYLLLVCGARPGVYVFALTPSLRLRLRLRLSPVAMACACLQVFRRLDANGDGRVTHAELARLLRDRGEADASGALRANAALREVDFERTRELGTIEFVNLLLHEKVCVCFVCLLSFFLSFVEWAFECFMVFLLFVDAEFTKKDTHKLARGFLL